MTNRRRIARLLDRLAHRLFAPGLAGFPSQETIDRLVAEDEERASPTHRHLPDAASGETGRFSDRSMSPAGLEGFED